jgi:hypothetical protein
MLDLMKIIGRLTSSPEKSLTKEQAAEVLRNDPELLRKLEKAYAEYSKTSVGDGLYDVSSKQASEAVRSVQGNSRCTNESDPAGAKKLTERIVDELVATVQGRITDGTPVTAEEVNRLPVEIRPQLAGNLIVRDLTDELPSLELLRRW